MKTPTNYNPDVLSCLANLSNDEVFTPPSLVNQILDMLPADLWQNKDAKFLDPVSKSGVFLREITLRLMTGLEKQIPDHQERINHILHNQIYGIAITKLTALLSRRSIYCSKTANGKYSVCSTFKNKQGNILFDRTEHTWENGKCIYCNANQAEYDRGELLETHAYQFIHTNEPNNLFNNMKFDVIIGNPPYQLNDGGGMGTSAMPIYDKFVDQAKKLSPRYLSMIIPARWYSGGKGLDGFRDSMLNDTCIRKIVDFPEASDCFPGVQIKGGVCYFLWDRDNKGKCTVITSRNGKYASEMTRPLLEDGTDTFIRYNQAISILNKVKKMKEASLMAQISARKPFGLDSNFSEFSKKPTQARNIKLYRYGDDGYVSEDQIINNKHLIKKLKVLISKAGSGSDTFPHQILGLPFIAEPNSVCTETYLILGEFVKKEQAKNLISYVQTKFFRFMVCLVKNTQNASRGVYTLVPIQDFDQEWTDEKLYKKYGITKDEQAFIDTLIRPME